MRSFTKDYPISVVAATQRVVHSPKIHSFGSCIYDAIADRFVQEPAYENIDVVDRIGSGDAYISGALYGLLAHARRQWNMAMLRQPLRIRFPVICHPPISERLIPLLQIIILQDHSLK